VTADATTDRDRIVRVRFSGLRTAAHVELDCEPMNVLIGPNGVGKSTLIEGLELLRKIPSGPDFVDALHYEHGGVSHLLRRGEEELRLGLDITDSRSSLSYAMILTRRNGSFAIQHESLHRDGEVVFMRNEDTLAVPPSNFPQMPLGTRHVLMKWPMVIGLSPGSPLVARVSNARNTFACLILGGYQVALDRTNRGGDFLNWQSRAWSLGPSIRWPIFAPFWISTKVPIRVSSPISQP
jgi:energy-coupling factor transporter ATP-binding protein EcfA2